MFSARCPNERLTWTDADRETDRDEGHRYPSDLTDAEWAPIVHGPPRLARRVACGPRGTDGNKQVRGIKRHVLTRSLGFVLASLVTTADVHDTLAAGAVLDRAARAGRRLERIKVDGIYVGARMGEAAERHGLDVQVTTPRATPRASRRCRCAGASRRRSPRRPIATVA